MKDGKVTTEMGPIDTVIHWAVNIYVHSFFPPILERRSLVRYER